jgi:hypothetical protein
VVDIVAEVEDRWVGHAVNEGTRYLIPNEMAGVDIMERCDKSRARK